MADRFWVGGSGNWSSTSKWSTTSGGGSGASVPTAADNARFDAGSSSVGYTVTIDINAVCLDFNHSAQPASGVMDITFSIGMTLTISGHWTIQSGSAAGGVGSGNVFILNATSSKNITTTNFNSNIKVTLDGVGGSWTLQANFGNTGSTGPVVQLNNGSFNANGFNLEIGYFLSNNANTRSVTMGSGTWKLKGANNFNLFDLTTSTGLTLNANTSTIKIVPNSAPSGTLVFAGGGQTYNNIWFAPADGHTFRITGSNTFNEFKADANAYSIMFDDATTTTVTTFPVNGGSGNVITIGTMFSVGAHNLVKSGGGTIAAQYLSISRSQASPASTWYAIASTDGGSNTGWTFTANTNVSIPATMVGSATLGRSIALSRSISATMVGVSALSRALLLFRSISATMVGVASESHFLILAGRANDEFSCSTVVYGNVSGPASYATGGFLIDLTASMSFVRFLSLEIETVGALASDEYEVMPNRDLAGVFSPGKAVVKLLRDSFDKFSISDVSTKPSGVSIRAAKFATGETTGSSHIHAIDHDHPSTTSSTPTAGGDGVDAVLGGVAIDTHTHAVDIAAFVANSPSGGTHTHDRSVEYQHNHVINQSETNVSIPEVTAGTNLSTTTWRFFAVGD